MIKYLNYILIIISVFLLNINNVFSQKNIDKGIDLFKINDYTSAIKIFEKEATIPENAELSNIYLGACYAYLSNNSEAERYFFGQQLKNSKLPEYFLYKGLYFKKTFQIAEAIKCFEQYKALKPDDILNKYLIPSCLYIKDNYNKEFAFAINNVKSLNTEYNEMSISALDDGMVISSSRNNDKKRENDYLGDRYSKQLDFYFAYWKDGQLLIEDNSYKVQGLNSNDFETQACFYNKDTRVCFAKTYKYTFNNIDKIISKIYYSKFDDINKWSSPSAAFDYNSDLYSIKYPFLSPDKKKLYFSSDMPGGYGGYDLYVCTLDATGKWSNPENLGNIINTVGNEISPYIFNSTLYFSSDFLPGYGGYDVFYSTLNNGYSAPQNMNQPINSAYDDYGLIKTLADRGFFISSRPFGLGKDDIYSFIKSKPIELNFEENILFIDDNFTYNGYTYKIECKEDKTKDDLVSSVGRFNYELKINNSYLLSSRENGFSDNEIYFNIKDNEGYLRTINVSSTTKTFYIKGSVADLQRNNGQIIHATLLLKNKIIKEIIVAKNGSYQFDNVLESGKNYQVAFTKENFSLKKEKKINTELVCFGNIIENDKGKKGVNVSLLEGNSILESTLSDDNGIYFFKLQPNKPYSIKAVNNTDTSTVMIFTFGMDTGRIMVDDIIFKPIVLANNENNNTNVELFENSNAKEEAPKIELKPTSDKNAVAEIKPIETKTVATTPKTTAPKSTSTAVITKESTSPKVLPASTNTVKPNTATTAPPSTTNITTNKPVNAQASTQVNTNTKYVIAKGIISCDGIVVTKALIKVLLNGSIVTSTYTNETGSYQLNELSSQRRYTLNISKIGYETLIIDLSTMTVDPDFPLNKDFTIKKEESFDAPIVKTENSITCKGVVTIDKQPIGYALLTLYNDGEPISMVRANKDGSYEIDISPEKMYAIRVSVPGQDDVISTFSTKNIDTSKDFIKNIEINFSSNENKTTLDKKTIQLTGKVHIMNVAIPDALVKLMNGTVFINEMLTDKSGGFHFELEKGIKYSLIVIKNGFQDGFLTIETNIDATQINKIIAMKPIVGYDEKDMVDISQLVEKNIPEISKKQKGDVTVHCHGDIKSEGEPLEDVLVEIFMNNEMIENYTTNTLGSYSFNVRGNMEYNIVASKYGYYSEKIVVQTNESLIDVVNDITLKPKAPLKVEGNLKFKNQPVDSATVSVSTQKELIDEQITNKEGKFFFDLVVDENYKIVATKKGFFQKQSSLSTEGKKENEVIKIEDEVDTIQKNVDIVLKNIYFDFNSSTLRPESHAELDRIKTFLDINNNIKVEISAHTDLRGEDDYNYLLSQRRANSVVDYLKYKNVKSNRMNAMPYGETKPIYPNATAEEEHQYNRRCEFTVLSYDEKFSDNNSKKYYEELENSEGLVYMVQVGNSKEPLEFGTFATVEDCMPGIKVNMIKGDDGIYRYVVCCFEFIEQAIKLKDIIEKKGFDAFVIAFLNGEKISIEQAKNIK